MKRILLSLLFYLFNLTLIHAQESAAQLLNKLDEKIRNKQSFVTLKEGKIKYLKTQKKAVNKSLENEYVFNHALFNEYKNYISDSAIHFLNLNIDLAQQGNDVHKLQESNIRMATFFVRLGMFKESSDILAKINFKSLNKEEQLNYTIAYRELYQGMGKYSQNTRDRNYYWTQAKSLNNTVLELSSESSEDYLKIVEKKLKTEKNYPAALKVNDQRLKLTEPNTSLYAYITFHRSLIYRDMGDLENEKRYLALSAISDIQLAINDMASISVLADILMNEGDINRAYAYIRFSLENIKEYNTRIRSSEILKIQAIIDQEYQIRIEKRSRELKGLLIISFILLILLVISVLYVYKQMKKGQAFSIKLKEINAELALFNDKLHVVNTELKTRNLEVAEANHIKEEYIAYFLDECSKYIVKLDNYRKMVNKKVQERQYDELYKITRDNSLKEDELKELFVNFDTMFINLFPNFLKDFNSLLLDDEVIQLKKEEGLNTELRIYALIRLGITDSTKIANFLGYSVNTIYNYRTKMKNKSKESRDAFEGKVKKIGTFN